MSTHRRNSPSQKALPLPDWPKADRETWRAAQETAGVLDDGRAAGHLIPILTLSNPWLPSRGVRWT
jgi:hypothetical protein